MGQVLLPLVPLPFRTGQDGVVGHVAFRFKFLSMLTYNESKFITFLST